MTKIFEDLQVYGLPKSDETAILAGLLNAEPILFIGPPGCNKTELIYMLGTIMRESTKRKYPTDKDKWINVHVYDTSKVSIEDFQGWPSTEALKRDEIKFIKHGTTIWDKDFVGLDELNRCSEERQSNFLELLRHRTCMGVPTKVKFIYSAINPFGDSGTTEMSDAIIDRHTFFLHFPTFENMDSETRLSIIDRVGNFDSYGIRYWTGKKFKLDALKDIDSEGNLVVNEFLADQGDRIFDLVQNAANIYEKIHSQYFRVISILIDNIVSKLKAQKDKKEIITISARRAGMIARAFIAYRAIDIARADLIGETIDNISNSVTSVVMSSLPIGVEKPASPDSITLLSQLVKDCVSVWQTSVLTQDEKDNNFIYDLYYNRNPISKLEALLSNPNIDSLAVNTAWNGIISNDMDIAALVYYAYIEVSGSVPTYLFSEEKIEEICNYVREIKEEEKANEQLVTWAPEFEKIIQKYREEEPNGLLHTCSIMCFRYINNTCKTDDEIYLKMNSLKSLLAKCHTLIKIKKQENTIDEPQVPTGPLSVF